jgi:hypothetical protein
VLFLLTVTVTEKAKKLKNDPQLTVTEKCSITETVTITEKS